MDWKSTLLLPETSFAMRGNLPSREPEMVARWRDEGLYRRMIERRADGPVYVMHDGPPYANGDLHHGHALNKILKDIVVKYRSMTGHRVSNVPGWDCHGLPIEQKVDEQLGRAKDELTLSAFRGRCREWAESWVGRQREQFERLLVLADWENPYRTMDPSYQASILRVFAAFADGGYIYRGRKPVHWSWAARTALAEAEVEYAPYTAPSIHVPFALPEPPAWLAEAAGGRSVDVVIWTTTPWTLPSNVAIVLHPDLEYALLALDDTRAILVAEGLRERALAACGLGELAVLHAFRGEKLVGRSGGDVPRPLARHPFLDRDSVLLPAEYVTLEQGTGCVHTAPGHGADDYATGLKYDLPVIAPVDDRGCYTDEVPDYAGQHVFKANPQIVERLHAGGRLLSSPGATVEIERYPHCWRTKKPLIFRATEQWFIAVDHADLRGASLAAIGRTRWVPGWGENRIRGMIEQRPDWCISRQRAWGVPIPVFSCGSCGDHVVSGEVARHVASLVEEHGADLWFESEPSALVPEGYVCPHCGGGADGFTRHDDILDVWFDSGSSWAAVVEAREGLPLPVDLYLEGSDQHRGWFHTSLLTSVAVRGDAPYRAVLTHGFVVDESGRKYSKSSPNFEPLAKMLERNGAEILRLWVAAVDYRGDVALAPALLKQIGDAYRKIRNTIRFLLGNLHDFDPASAYDVAPTTLDRWALARTADYLDQVRDGYEEMEFHRVFHTALDFCNLTLSSVYLDALKDRLYCEDAGDPSRRATQRVLYEALRGLVLSLAPVLSFTAEEAWGHLPRRADDPDSVFLATFGAPGAASPGQRLLSDLEDSGAAWSVADARAVADGWVAVRERVNEAIEARRPAKKGERVEGQIGSSQEAAVTLTVAPRELDRWSSVVDELAELFIVASVTVEAGEVPAGDVEVSVAPSPWPRCARCWNHRGDIGAVAEHPDLCGRCAAVVSTA
ncbi:MAG: isoleucine--tRNA ligase [Deltaproteobacteria bacterium]|nr:MAG: isoleucine--tRNA ligase [Deltaproteobacteria bacterium]